MNTQKGLTLVELMIAIAIGLFLIAAVSSLLITTNRSIQITDASSQTQETGRFAMEYLSRYIRMAGYQKNAANSIGRFDALYMSSSVGFPCTVADACAADDVNEFGDRISLPFEASADDLGVTDCAGVQAGGSLGTQRLVNVFYVDQKTLFCRVFDIDEGTWRQGIDEHGNKTGIMPPTPILNNIEALHFLIGLASDEDQQFAAQYVKVTSSKFDNKNLVRSFKISALVTGQDVLEPEKVAIQKAKRQYNLLDALPIYNYDDSNPDGDAQVRSIFAATIGVTNLIESAVSSQATPTI